jgi:SAM-dependent methyltransferase
MNQEKVERRSCTGARGAPIVRNLLGMGCPRYVEGDEAALADVAAWATLHCSEIEAILHSLWAQPGRMHRAEIRFYEDLRRHGWITGDARPRLTRSGRDAFEVLNRSAAGDRTVETVGFLEESASIGPSSRVLDVGCSTGRLLRIVAERSPRRMAGVDQDLFALYLAALGWGAGDPDRAPQWHCASAQDLPFREGEFTHVLCFVTLNFLPVRAALGEIARVLDRGGQLVATVEGEGYWRRKWRLGGAMRRVHLLRELAGNLALPRCDWQRFAALRKVSQRVYFSPASIERLVTEAGLAVERNEVLCTDGGAPRLIGVTARKR